MQKTAIIIPCYNEEKRIDGKNIDYLAANTAATIFFANDGSTDNTLVVLSAICERYPGRCFILDYKENSGKANTIYKSVNHLYARGEFAHIGYFDADFSTPPKEVKRLIEKAASGKAAFMLGSRVKLLNSGIKRKIHRHYIGRIIITLVSMKFDTGIYDTQCGAKIFSAEIVPYGFSKPFFTSWLFDVEIFIRLKQAGQLHKGREIPLKRWEDVEGSKLSWKSAFKILRELYLLVKHY